jgi:hypothetical protein
MNKKYAIYLSDSTIVLCTVGSSGVELLLEEYASNQNFEEKCKTILEKYKETNVDVFLDLIGEEYKHESIPHVRGKDGELLLARKQQSLFPGADLVWKTHVKREKTGRKDDVYLMMGLQLPKMVKDVFSLLIENEYAVSGVYSISILGTEIQKVLPDLQQYLTISRVLGRQQSDRSYRQTFTKNKEIVISRVTRAKGGDIDEAMVSLMTEIERMHHFLNGAKHLGVNHTLNVIGALGEHENRKLLSNKAGNNIEFRYVDLYELASKLGLKRPESLLSLPELLTNLAVTKQVKPHFKPEDLCAKFQRNYVSSLLKRTSVAIVLLAVIGSAGLWWGAQNSKEDVKYLQAQIEALNSQHEDIGTELSGEEISPQLMKSVVDAYDALSNNQYAPEDALGVIAEAYIGFHDISILEITWVTTKSNESNTQEDQQEALLDTIKKPRKFAIKLGLPPSLSDRKLVNRVNSFSESLLNHGKITEVEQTSATINIQSNASMERTVSTESENGKPIEFTLLLTMKL